MTSVAATPRTRAANVPPWRLEEESTPFRSAMSMLTFYGNRAGRTLSATRAAQAQRGQRRVAQALRQTELNAEISSKESEEPSQRSRRQKEGDGEDRTSQAKA
jgi:hypothetical protein